MQPNVPPHMQPGVPPHMQPGASRPRKKSPWLLAMGALVLGAPGALTMHFAIREASGWAGEWVLISTPLLVLAGVCLALAGKRLLGWAGLGVGAAVTVVGLVVGFAMLGSAIARRAEAQRQYEEIRALSSFCDGAPAPNARAMPHSPGAPGRSPMLVFEKQIGSGSFTRSYDATYDALGPPDGADISGVALVACVEPTEQLLEECPYSGGRVLRRVQRNVNVHVFAAQSGQRVAHALMQGEAPRACQISEEFYGEGGTNTLGGPAPTDEAVAAVLQAHVARTAQ